MGTPAGALNFDDFRSEFTEKCPDERPGHQLAELENSNPLERELPGLHRFVEPPRRLPPTGDGFSDQLYRGLRGDDGAKEVVDAL